MERWSGKFIMIISKHKLLFCLSFINACMFFCLAFFSLIAWICNSSRLGTSFQKMFSQMVVKNGEFPWYNP